MFQVGLFWHAKQAADVAAEEGVHAAQVAAASEAFADMPVSSFRRVIQNAAGVTFNMSNDVRFFASLARLGVQLTTTEGAVRCAH